MAEQTKCNEQYDGDNTVRCERSKGHTGAHRGDSFARPVSCQWPAAQPEAAPAQVAEPENHAPNGDWKAGFGFSEPTSSSAPQIPADLAARKELWLNHGHHRLYGDDGEMQCDECLATKDYKRAPFEKVALQAAQALRAALAAERAENLNLRANLSASYGHHAAAEAALAAERERTNAIVKAAEEFCEAGLLSDEFPRKLEVLEEALEALSRTEPEAQK